MQVKRVPNWDGTKESTELYHHGIKGQRWGKRNYQNTDGSLTTAGKLRYAKGNRGVTRNTTFEIQSKKGKAYPYEAMTRAIKTAYGGKDFSESDYDEVRRNTHKQAAPYAKPQTINGVFYPGTDDDVRLDRIMTEKYGTLWKERADNGDIAYDTTESGLRKAKSEEVDRETKEHRKHKYEYLAGESRYNSETHKINNRHISTKVKRFVDSFKEVHTENIDKTKKGFKKAVKAVKNYFNLKMP